MENIVFFRHPNTHTQTHTQYCRLICCCKSTTEQSQCMITITPTQEFRQKVLFTTYAGMRSNFEVVPPYSDKPFSPSFRIRWKIMKTKYTVVLTGSLTQRYTTMFSCRAAGSLKFKCFFSRHRSQLVHKSPQMYDSGSSSAG